MPSVLQVRQRLDQALHVAAVAAFPDVALALVEILVAGRLRRARPSTSRGPGDEALVVLVAGIVGLVAVAETLGEDLVPDGVLGPVGRVERRLHRANASTGRRSSDDLASVDSIA